MRADELLLACDHALVAFDGAVAELPTAGTQVTVVSSLAPTVVRSFLVVHGLADYARHVAARTGPDRTVPPPHQI